MAVEQGIEHDLRLLTPEGKGQRARRWQLPYLLIALGMTGLVYASLGCNKPPAQALEMPTPESTPTQPVTIVPTNTAEPEPTIVPIRTPQPPAISTPEITQEQPYGILPEKYLALAERFEVESQEGVVYTYIGFRLPPNVPIFSPEDLTLKKGITGGDPFLGSLASMTNPDDHTMASLTVYGDFLHLEGMIPSSKQVKQGEEFAKTQNTGVKMFKGDYNIVITAFRKNPSGQGFIIDEERYERLFPQASKNPIGKKVIQNGPVKPNFTFTYSSSPSPQ